jgi:hypothetical protein
VPLDLGGSLALLFNGPDRSSFNGDIVPAMFDDLSGTHRCLDPLSLDLPRSFQGSSRSSP